MPVYPEAGTLRGILEVLNNNNNKCGLISAIINKYIYLTLCFDNVMCFYRKR